MSSKSENILNQAYGFIYRKNDGEIEMLIVEELDGSWSFPGGAQEESDVDIGGALHREIKEELGILSDKYEARPMDISVSFLYNNPKSSRFGKTGVIEMFLMDGKTLDVAPQKEHIKSIAWVGADEAKSRFQFIQHQELVDHCFDYLEKL